MGVLDAVFGNSPRKARRTSKKLNRSVRLNMNQRSASVTVGGKKTRATIGRKGVKAKVFGFQVL